MFQPLVFDWQQGEFRQLPAGEKLAASAFTYVINYSTPTILWQIPHGLNIYLPNIPYYLISKGSVFFAGVDEKKSDVMQTTLLLTSPMEGTLTYILPEFSS